jgi:hypothetical protein
MTRINLTPQLSNSLERKTLTYNFKDWESAVWLLNKGIKSRTLPSTVLKKWPRRIVMVMYKENSDTDSQLNPFYFRHNNVRDVTLDVSGVKFSHKGLSWKAKEKDYNTSGVYYEAAVASGGLNDFPFSFQDFMLVYSIFVFDVTKTRYGPSLCRFSFPGLTRPFFRNSALCDFRSVPDGPASFGGELVFDKVLESNQMLSVFFEYDSVFSISPNGECRIE